MICTCSLCLHDLDIKSQPGYTARHKITGELKTIPGTTNLTCWNLDCDLYGLTFTLASYPADPHTYLQNNDVSEVVRQNKERCLNANLD